MIIIIVIITNLFEVSKIHRFFHFFDSSVVCFFDFVNLNFSELTFTFLELLKLILQMLPWSFKDLLGSWKANIVPFLDLILTFLPKFFKIESLIILLFNLYLLL